MEAALQLLNEPAIQCSLFAVPMLFLLDGRRLHFFMSKTFTRYVVRSLPVALLVAVFASITHTAHAAMGVGVMTPFLQWGAIKLLYRRFVRSHGRPPKSPSERTTDETEIDDTAFRIAANMLLVGLPLLALLLAFKIP